MDGRHVNDQCFLTQRIDCSFFTEQYLLDQIAVGQHGNQEFRAAGGFRRSVAAFGTGLGQRFDSRLADIKNLERVTALQ